MALNINTNAYSQVVQKNLSTSQSGLMTSMQRLSSGMRINSAADDAAGLAISDRMNSMIRSQQVALRNVNDGTSMTQIADGAASNITDNLQRMRELAMQAASGTMASSSSDRTNLQGEMSNLLSQIDNTVKGAKFNGVSLVNNANTVDVQSGTAGSTGDTSKITLQGTDLQASALGVNSVTLDTVANAQAALSSIDSAIDKISTARASFGASMSQLNQASTQLNTSIQNQSAAKGRITDTDYASETANLSRTQVLQQAGMAMLSQANQLPQQVLSLLR